MSQIEKDKNIDKLLRKLVFLAKKTFKDKLVSCYVIGSLAHGGFSPLVSDVDFCIILSDPFIEKSYEKKIQRLKKEIIITKLHFSERVSLFYASIDTLENQSGAIRMPAYDKLDLIDHGRCLYGKDIRNKLTKPNQLDIAIEGLAAYFNVMDIEAVIQDIQDLPSLVKEGEFKKISKLILWPARFIFSAQTNQLAHNANTVEYFIKHCETLDQVNLVKWGYALRALPSQISITDVVKQYATLGAPIASLLALYTSFLSLYQEKLPAGKDKALDSQIQEAMVALEAGPAL